MTRPWAYRCSVCEELVEINEVSKHIEQHQAKRDYSGYVGFTREDKDIESEQND